VAPYCQQAYQEDDNDGDEEEESESYLSYLFEIYNILDRTLSYNHQNQAADDNDTSTPDAPRFNFFGRMVEDPTNNLTDAVQAYHQHQHQHHRQYHHNQHHRQYHHNQHHQQHQQQQQLHHNQHHNHHHQQQHAGAETLNHLVDNNTRNYSDNNNDNNDGDDDEPSDEKNEDKVAGDGDKEEEDEVADEDEGLSSSSSPTFIASPASPASPASLLAHYQWVPPSPTMRDMLPRNAGMILTSYHVFVWYWSLRTVISEGSRFTLEYILKTAYHLSRRLSRALRFMGPLQISSSDVLCITPRATATLFTLGVFVLDEIVNLCVIAAFDTTSLRLQGYLRTHRSFRRRDEDDFAKECPICKEDDNLDTQELVNYCMNTQHA